MFLPNTGSGSWPDSIRGAHGNGCYGAQSDPETTLVWGFAPVTLAQGSTALSGLQGPWPCMPSQSSKESQAGAGGWVADLQGHQCRRSREWARLGKKLGAPLQGDVTCDAQAGEEDPANPERSACWQRRRPRAGLAEASGHGEPGAEALLGEDGSGGGDHGYAQRGLQMVPEQLLAHKMVR